MTSPIPSTPQIASAETDATTKERLEALAEERFLAVRAQLEQSGQPQKLTQTPEFQQWMQARAETDSAWGRWALAVDQVRAAA